MKLNNFITKKRIADNYIHNVEIINGVNLVLIIYDLNDFFFHYLKEKKIIKNNN